MTSRRPMNGLRVACLALSLLGSAGAQSTSPPTSPPASTPASEAQGSAEKQGTEQRLRAVLGEIDALREVRAELRHGVVKLSGKVPTPAARENAESVARAMPGVVYVENKIELPAPPKPSDDRAGDAAEPVGEPDPAAPSASDQRIAERLAGIFSRVAPLADVRVEVAAGVVALRGTVVEADDRKDAEELAKSIDGVLFVDNRIEQTADLSERILPSVEKIAGHAQDMLLKLPLIAVALLVVALFWWLARRIGRADRAFQRLTDKPLIQGILRQVVKTLLLVLGVFLALEILGATALVGAVLGTAGVVGLAVGFAFRDIVENYLASIMLSFRQPFQAKDLVEIDGKLGSVIRMNTRETVLLTAQGNHLTMPNATVFKSTIVNYTRAPLRRFDIGVGVGTDVDLKLATALGLDVLARMAGVVGDPEPFARIEALGDSTVTLRFYGWVDQRSADFGKVQSEAVRLIKGVMDENDVDMPEPTYRVAIRRPGHDEDSGDSDRPVRGSARQEAAAADVEPERHIEEQIDAELQQSDEVDLLDGERDVAAGDSADRPLAGSVVSSR